MSSQSAVRGTARRLLARQATNLDEWLSEHRTAGHSYEAIATELHDLTDGLIRVSYRTIARWCADLEDAA